MPRRLSSALRGRRALVAGAFALCVALVPGTARAEEDPPAAPPPPEGVTVLEAPEGQTASEEEPPPFAIPPEVVDALRQFAEQAGFTEECVDGVVAGLEQIGNGIAGLPTELQQLLTDLGTAVQEQIADPEGSALEDFLSRLAPAPPAEGSQDPSAPPLGADIVAGLQNLAAALEACRPAPPSEQPPPPPAQQPPTALQPQQQPPAPQAPVQPAVYPGYAPTGAEQTEDGPSPAAIGTILALVAAGAGWAEWRRNAAPR